MPDNDYAAAVEAAEKLKKLDDDTLIEELGLRVEAEKQPGGKELVSNFDGDFDDFSDFSPAVEPLTAPFAEDPLPPSAPFR